ncbi:uncharacterized protein LOC135374675 [Ornithodoros turicata]|uniref:uncharacterized protein LOC135374675 n=1 Tax=Ornithodoros turicata TaxID=34597 RepID=UPI00313A07BD
MSLCVRTYEEARSKLDRFQYTSDAATESGGKARKRKRPQRFLDDSSEDDDPISAAGKRRRVHPLLSDVDDDVLPVEDLPSIPASFPQATATGKGSHSRVSGTLLAPSASQPQVQGMHILHMDIQQMQMQCSAKFMLCCSFSAPYESFLNSARQQPGVTDVVSSEPHSSRSSSCIFSPHTAPHESFLNSARQQPGVTEVVSSEPHSSRSSSSIFSPHTGQSQAEHSVEEDQQPRRFRQPSSIQEFQKQVLRLLYILRHRQQQHGDMLQELCSRNAFPEQVLLPPALIRAPFGSVAQLEEFNSQMNDTRKEQLVRELAELGGTEFGAATRTALQYIMTDFVACEYSWKGQKGKRKFCILCFPAIILACTFCTKSLVSQAPKEVCGSHQTRGGHNNNVLASARERTLHKGFSNQRDVIEWNSIASRICWCFFFLFFLCFL